ncbi:MAG: hypothetical protein KA282_00030 [Clostridia bacterium]|jgi:hypothetical protein|nr:hypothetical protein [Clostridia bacterium]
MGWGQFFAGMAWDLTKTSVKTSVEAGRHAKMKYQMRRDLLNKQEENRRNRMLMVEESLLRSSNLPQIGSEKRMLLEGESTPIQMQLALHGGIQRNYYNTIISGGSADIRALALLKTCEDAYDSGLPTIIIHCGNRSIENYIIGSSTIHNRVIINSTNGLYDPFLGLSNTDITNLFIQAAPDYVRQNWNFSALIGLIVELYEIRQKKNINLKTLLKTKVMDLPKKIQNSRNTGLINDTKMLELNQRYQFAQSDANGLQQYLYQLQSKFQQFYANNNGTYRGLGKALNGNNIVTVDITDASNEEFVRLIVNNLLLLRRRGLDFIACFADLNLNGYNGVVMDYAVNGSNKFSVCSADIVSSAGGNDKLNTLLGYVKSCVFFNHSNGNHCNVLSDSLGTYRRWNIAYTHGATNRGIIPDMSAGSNISENPAAKRVPPEILLSLSGNQMVYKDGESNEIFMMCLN